MEDTAGEEAVEQERAFQRRQPMGNEMPVPVAFRAVLAESEDLVVYACGLDVYSNGVGFSVEARVRHGMDEQLLESLTTAEAAGSSFSARSTPAAGAAGLRLAGPAHRRHRHRPADGGDPRRCRDPRYRQETGSPVSLRPHEPTSED